jgi:hypothetical protein
MSANVSIRQHTSAYVSIRQHTSAYVSIRQHARPGEQRDDIEREYVKLHVREVEDPRLPRAVRSPKEL